MKQHRKFWTAVAMAMVAAVLAAVPGAPAGASSHVTPIYEIQGEGHLSPFTGTGDVTTHGVVTAIGFNSFWVQDPLGDGNDATSDAMFVFDSRGSTFDTIAVGTCVELDDDVDERISGGAATGNLSLTQMAFPRIAVIDCGSTFPGYSFPSPVVIGEDGRIPPNEIVISEDELPVNLQDVPGEFDPDEDGIDFYESLENMLVTVEKPQAVSATRQFSTFSAEFFTVPNRGDDDIVSPEDAINKRGGIMLQPHPDGTGDLNPERVQIQLLGSPLYEGSMFPPAAVQVGDRLQDVTGVMSYSFGNYEVNAISEIVVTKSKLKPESSKIEGKKNHVTVASYNVLNLSPGSSDDAQRALLAAQIVNDLNSPDVIAVQEIQDNSGTTDDGITDASQTLQALVDAIVAAGGPNYGFFDVAPADGTGGGVPGGNIRNAFLYNRARVGLVDYESLTPDVLAANGVTNTGAFSGTRNPLAATFAFNTNQFTVVNNHLTSRFGSSPIFGGPQPFVQAGEDGGAGREDQTAALNEYVDHQLAGDDDGRIMVVGDFNTFEWTNDLTEILPGTGDDRVLTNLVPTADIDDDDDDGDDDDDNELPEDAEYSFIFDGNSQMLDQFFVTDNLEDDAKFDVVHLNVDFPRRFDDDTASDHEPLLARFKMKAPKRTVELQLLAFNDYHGHVEAGTPGSIEGSPAGGSEYLSSMLSLLREGSKHSLTVAAGDLIGGTPSFSGLFHDEPSVETLNAMHLDVSGVGNHEFDEGVTELLRMQNGGCHPVDGCYFADAPYAGADFQWLAANVVDDTGATPLPPYWIDKVDGVKVAFIGMTLEATDVLVAAAGIQGYTFLDEAETANALVPVLQDQGVEAIVVLLHEGGLPSPIEINGCNGISGPIVAINDALSPAIDAIITGHTHQPYNCVLDDPSGQGRTVTSAFSFGRVVSEINLVLDKKTKDVRRDLTWANNHVVSQTALTPDPALTAVINKWAPLAAAAGDIPIGTITADITRGGTPPGSDRGVESAASNLVADAQQWSSTAAGAQVAFMNPGGVRSDLTFAASGTEGDGVVTFGEAFTFQPFGNTLQTVPMTGAQILSVLGEQCQPAGSSRPILHLGVSDGFTYDLATTVVAGDCTGISITNVQLNGVALDTGATYKVTVNSFLADGGDNFTTFAAIDPSLRADGGNDLEALVNYLGTFGPVAPPSTDRVNELP